MKGALGRRPFDLLQLTAQTFSVCLNTVSCFSGAFRVSWEEPAQVCVPDHTDPE